VQRDDHFDQDSAVAGSHDEVRHGLELFPPHPKRRDEPEEIGSRDGFERIVATMHPGNDLPVSHPEDELHVHWHFPALADDDTDDFRSGLAKGHEVDDQHRSVVRLVPRFQDQCAGPVAPRRPGGVVAWTDRPVAVLRGSQERREARLRIEARQAKPVDGACFAHESCAAAVADERVVFYR
jgi:hypothetical protein